MLVFEYIYIFEQIAFLYMNAQLSNTVFRIINYRFSLTGNTISFLYITNNICKRNIRYICKMCNEKRSFVIQRIRSFNRFAL